MNDAYAEIQDQKTYVARMNKSLIDKLFFVDKVDADVFVDFGCAKGDLLEIISQWSPDGIFIGYDNNPSMINAARSVFDQDLQRKDQFHFFVNWEEVKTQTKAAQRSGKKVAIVLSSIIHEVYHYSEPKDIGLFWKRVFETGFDYIIIRDMMPSQTVDRPSDPNDISRIYRKFLYTQELRDFESSWGSIENNKNLTHFLLKYRYKTPNWEREVAENYMPLFRENLMAKIPLEYSVIFHEHYVLPYIRRQIKKDIGIDLKDPTHLKLILEKSKDD